MVTTAFSIVSRHHLSSTRDINPAASKQSSLYSRPASGEATIDTNAALHITFHMQPNMPQPAMEAGDLVSWYNCIDFGACMDPDPEITNIVGPEITNMVDPEITNIVGPEITNMVDPEIDPEITNIDIDLDLYSELNDGAMGLVPGEVNMTNQDGYLGLAVNDDLQSSREQNILQQAHYPQNLLQDSSLQNYNPVSPTTSTLSYGTSQPFTPQSSNEDFSSSSPTYSFAWPEDADPWNTIMVEGQSPPPASNIEQIPSPMIWGSLSPMSNTPLSPLSSTSASSASPTSPSQPLTPAPSQTPLSPTGTSSSDRTGRGSISKPVPKRRRRNSNSSGISKTLRCDFAGDGDSAPCNKEFERNCDLTKHKKRHRKDFPCRFEGCTNTRGFPSEFSSEKDRERHENCIHKKQYLTCTECGHETTRKDNMKDHVLRKHGKHTVQEIMQRIMAAPKTCPKRLDGKGV